MHVSVTNGQASIVGADGVLHLVPYEPLTDADMLLQARYHLWARKHEYRRSLICRRCKTPMETDTKASEEAQTWELLTVCSCRAIYGKIPLSAVASAMTT